MMMLINELQNHVTNNNILFIDELSDIIIEEKINTPQELEKYENDYNDNLSIDKAITKWINVIDNYHFEYDGLLYDQIQELQKERELINDDNLDNKVLHLIKYYYLTKRDNPFPYQTYKFIIQDKL